jgi:hypothetical protein
MQQILVNIFSDLIGTASHVTALFMIIIIGLLFAIHFLIKDRRRLITALGKKDDNILEVINKFEKSQFHTVTAMSKLRELLIEVKAKLM